MRCSTFFIGNGKKVRCCRSEVVYAFDKSNARFFDSLPLAQND